MADTEPLTNTTRTYTWNTSNQVTGVSYSAGGMQRAYTYDTAGRLVSDTLTGDNTTQRQSQYAYDSAGRLASETISGTAAVVGQGVNSYTYDIAGRLASWTAPSATTTSYGWDDNGNRTNNGTITSTYDARNRLTGSSNGDSYTWSARGTMVSQTVSGQTSDYSFDGLGRSVTAAGVGVHYDALDRLAERSDGNGGWVQFSYSGTGLQPVSDGASLIARSPSGDPVAVKTGTAPGVSVVADRHGDVIATFNPTAGTIQGSVEFDPFGQTITSSGVQAGSVGYQGAYTDPTNGLVDMGARWYQPSTGRFTARDTIRPMLQSPISLNMYTYANDDPLGFFDPDGHQAVTPTPDACERTGQCSKQGRGQSWRRHLGIAVPGKRNGYPGQHIEPVVPVSQLQGVVPAPPYDPYDGTHTRASVQAYLLDKYSLDGKAFSQFKKTFAVSWALNTNRNGRTREDESMVSVARLYATHFQRRFNPEAPYLTSMDNFALTVALPWADVQSAAICGSDNGAPIYCVGVSRLPTVDPDAIAVTLGHFILVDATEQTNSIKRDKNGNYMPDPELLAHELTHLDRGEAMSHEDELGVDDRQYWKLYGMGGWVVEEKCANQVGQGDFEQDHIVRCGVMKA